MVETTIAAVMEDLGSSGLQPSDLGARSLEGPERAATKTPHSSEGYVIPYYDFFGKPLPHYRVKLLNNTDVDGIKYRQPKDSPTHVYFPKTFLQVLKAAREQENRNGNVIFITEGEKKAALANKLHFPTVALGGVDAWRNRVIVMPGEPSLTAKGKDESRVTKAKIDPGSEISEDFAGGLALGMQDIIDYALQYGTTIIIVFDSDKLTGVRPQVQRAAATLGFELRSKGIAFSRIRQIILPTDNSDADTVEEKTGLDDFLLSESGYETFQSLVTSCLQKRTAFPRHPSIADYVGKRLQRGKLTRKDAQNVSLAILCELDSTGQRLKSKDEQAMYYFDNKTRTLMKAGFLYGQTDKGAETTFGSLLYQRFGIGVADQRALQWLSAQFNGELPINNVSPERIIARTRKNEDCVRYQINDGQYVVVNKDGIRICDNGYDGVLFEGGHVQPVDARELAQAFVRQSKAPITNWWSDVLRDTRLKDHKGAQSLHSLLYYVSPWLYRWRGTQLPIEIALGESGSGKSTLFGLRLSILTGEARLRNAPRDIKDWHASVINSGALHVTDNVQLTDPQLRQLLSDELCRLVTEPDPFVEQRKYFTNSDLVRYPVRSCFAITSIKQPFQNADIMQRSVVLELEKPADGNSTTMYDTDWGGDRLEGRGGRTMWLAHHLFVLQCFFKLVEKEWQPAYSAKHRLINFEQALMLMAKVFEYQAAWLPNFLVSTVEDNISKADWVFEGLKAWMEEHVPEIPEDHNRPTRYLTADISDWMIMQEDFKDSELLCSPRRLGRWMQDHKGMIAQSLGIIETMPINNRMRYRIVKLVKKEVVTDIGPRASK
jgi:hypothetical protein